jgi:UDP-N-acetylmuramoyl-L-alanyl-D-glutamate--2,6-diaminopimelate ligase
MNRLLDEIRVLETRGDPAATEILGIEHDSRVVSPGDLFCCLPGARADGHDYAADAVRRGAVGLVCEHFVASVPPGPPGAERSVVQARVADGAARPAMARLAAAFHGFPSRALTVVGVTGTNGKTTVTRLLEGIFETAGMPCAVVGTLTGERTTPESTDLQRILASVRDEQRRDGRSHAVAMEVSSHALVQARVDAIHFDTAIFTNLSHDHLDFHGTMEEYGAAKAQLFHPERALRGVVNVDDAWGSRIAATARIPIVPVRRADAADVEVTAGRTSFRWRGLPVVLQLTGALNIDNALVAAEAACSLGIDPDVAVAGLASVPGVPGRLEVVAGIDDVGFTVLVDYAHTPAALRAVLSEARRIAGSGRVVAVFGCGGNRDRAKRPLMGAAAAALADRSVLTSDNPRDEDPAAIIGEVLAGVPAGTDLVVEADRRQAIGRAVAGARRGDVVVIAGKGHETEQRIGGRAEPFDDRVVAAEALAARGGAAADAAVRGGTG